MSNRTVEVRDPDPARAVDDQRWKSIVAGGFVAAMLGAQAAALPQAFAAPSPVSAAAALSLSRPASFAHVVERVQPAVVSIATSGRLAKADAGAAPSQKKRFAIPDLPDDLPFSELFRHFFEENAIPDGPRAWGQDMRGLGSGFIIDPTGYVVTNHHVVKNAADITVVLADGTRLPADVRGSDSKTDLALLKVEADQSLPYVEFADSDAARVGDWVLAVGNPFGLGGTVTAGIVSARGRDIEAGPFDDFIQIDAPINRGNSGGPLFDVEGRVIGVNTSIYSPSGGNVGIGFAIPADQAKPILAELKAKGSVTRGWLGVHIQPVSQEVAQSLGISRDAGILVAGVDKQGPAAEAGIRAGDVILQFGGKALDDFRELPHLVANTKAGSSVKLRILRQGDERTVSVKIGNMPGQDRVVLNTEDADGDASPRIGLHVASLNKTAREKYGIPEDRNGVLVVDVERGSPAEQAGIQTGSVVSMVGQEPVVTPADLAGKIEQVAAQDRPSVLLLVSTGDEQRFIVVKFKTA